MNRYCIAKLYYKTVLLYHPFNYLPGVSPLVTASDWSHFFNTTVLLAWGCPAAAPANAAAAAANGADAGAADAPITVET